MLCTQFNQELDQYLGISLGDPAFGWVIELESDESITETLDLSSLHVENNRKDISGGVEYFEFDFAASSFFNGCEKGFKYIAECFTRCRVAMNPGHSNSYFNPVVFSLRFLCLWKKNRLAFIGSAVPYNKFTLIEITLDSLECVITDQVEGFVDQSGKCWIHCHSEVNPSFHSKMPHVSLVRWKLLVLFI